MQEKTHTKCCAVCGKPLLTPDIAKKRRACSRGNCTQMFESFLSHLENAEKESTTPEVWQKEKKAILNGDVPDYFPLARDVSMFENMPLSRWALFARIAIFEEINPPS